MKGGEQSWSNWGKSFVPHSLRKTTSFLQTQNNKNKIYNKQIIFLLSSIIYNLIVKYYEKKEYKPENIKKINNSINTRNVIGYEEFNRRRCELLNKIKNDLEILQKNRTQKGIIDFRCPNNISLNSMTTYNLREKIIGLYKSLNVLLVIFKKNLGTLNYDESEILRKEYKSIKDNLLNL
jgi:hypothetical protein